MSLKEERQSSLLKKKTLLESIIESPSKYSKDTDIVKALSSQAAFAKFYDSSLSITSSSALNTFKTNAELLIDGGFITLDGLRITAKSAIDNKKPTKSAAPRTRTAIQSKNTTLKEQLNILRQDNTYLTVIVGDLRAELKRFATTSENNSLMVDYKKVNKKITAKLSLINDRSDSVAMDIPHDLVDSFQQQIDEYLKRR